MANPPLYFASDHAGFELKSFLLKQLQSNTCIDLGPQNKSPVDYPDFARILCQNILADAGSLGVLICGTGIGMSIAANRSNGIRAALCTDPWSATLAREHNHANVLCLGARIIAPEFALKILESFLTAKPSSEIKHLTRVKKL